MVYTKNIDLARGDNSFNIKHLSLYSFDSISNKIIGGISFCYLWADLFIVLNNGGET